MPNHLRIMNLFCAIAAIVAMAMPADARPPASASVLGDWRGSYVCAQGLTGLHLSVLAARKGRLNAIFDFSPVKDNPLVPHGRYAMSGEFNAKTGRLALRAGRWIEQPIGYFTVDLDGYLNTPGDRITGVVPAAGCSVFDLVRVEALID